jgi:Cytochrome c554 and c-prime
MTYKMCLFFVIIITPIYLTFGQTETPKHSYVGVKTCAMCHKSEKQGDQYKVWEGSKHSKAYDALKTDEANKIAKEKGFDKPAAEVPECLKCHVTAYNVDPKFLGAKFDQADGVQCEACHGPGSDYKSLKVMKDEQEAIKNGLMIYKDPKELCVKCHNSESPTFKSFDFATYWDKIKHPIPKK